MTQINTSLKQLMLEGEGELNYKATLNGETFQITVDVGKNPTKKGIKLEFIPTNPKGDFIHNLTPEEIDTLQNSLITSLGPKFAKYKLEISRDTDAPEKQSVNLWIPLDSLFIFIKEMVLNQ